MAKAKSLPDRAVLHTLLECDPETGLLTWKERPPQSSPPSYNERLWNKRFAGKPALTVNNGMGYLVGKLLSKSVYAHRVVWKMMTGEDPAFLDHINGNKSDNRIANLRSVSAQTSSRNLPRRSTNTSGVQGVSWIAARCKWLAQINVGGKNVNLGRFATLEEAVAARKAAEVELGYHPNHGR